MKRKPIITVTLLVSIATIMLAADPVYRSVHRMMAVAEAPEKIEQLRVETSGNFQKQSEKTDRLSDEVGTLNKQVAILNQHLEDALRAYRIAGDDSISLPHDRYFNPLTLQHPTFDYAVLYGVADEEAPKTSN